MKVTKQFVGTEMYVTSGIVEVLLDSPAEAADLASHTEWQPGSTAYCARTDGQKGLNVWHKWNDGTWTQVAGEDLDLG